MHTRTNAMKTVAIRARFSFVIAAILTGLGVAPHPAAAAPAARLQVVAVLPPTGDNVAPDLLKAARDILKDHLQRAGTYTVVEPAVPSASAAAPPSPVTVPPASADEPTATQAAQAATTLGAEIAVVLRVTHFGNS